MGLRRAQGSRSKQYDSHERRHILVDRPRVRESGMRLPSEMARGCALSVAVSLKLTLMGYCRARTRSLPSGAHDVPGVASRDAK